MRSWEEYNMARLNIALPEDLVERLRFDADAEGVNVSTIIENRLQFAPNAAPEKEQKAFTLDEAAEVFMSVLDRGHVELIRSCAADTKQRPSAYLLSAIKLAHENGQTSLLLPSCLGERLDPLAIQTGQVQCDWCHDMFTMTRPGQKYCPQPKTAGQESCSRQAALDAIRNRPRHTSASAAAFAPPSR